MPRRRKKSPWCTPEKAATAAAIVAEANALAEANAQTDPRLRRLMDIARGLLPEPPEIQRLRNFEMPTMFPGIDISMFRNIDKFIPIGKDFAKPAEPKPTLCGARMGRRRCKARALPGKQRCRFHGGCSTGPRSEEGRQRISVAQKKRWARVREEAGKP